MEEKDERRDEQAPLLTIEESFRELEGILEKLEDEESSLEESFRWFEKGMKLVRSCAKQIDQVEKKMIVLSEGEDNAGV